jgi:polygalacturonase
MPYRLLRLPLFVLWISPFGFPRSARCLRLLSAFVIFHSSVCASPGAANAAADLHLLVAPSTLRSDSVTLLWDKAAPASARVTYQLHHNGQPLATTAKTHFTATGLSPEHDHTFSVIALPADPYSTPVHTSSPTTSSASAISHSSLDIRHSSSAPLATSNVSFRTPATEPVVNVLDHGAVGDGTTLDTAALQSAINACPPRGVVLIPAGTFLSGALYLKSDMTLEIAANGVLKGTVNPADYTPFNRNRFEGWEMDTHASLLNAGTLDSSGPANIRNLTLRGAGKISGGGRKLYDATMALYPKKVDGLRARGRLILLMNAENVSISGLTIEESPGWTLHYIYSANISLHGLTIRSDVHNGDGIDPDSSKNSYIFDTTFDTGDDCIAIKSGKNPEGDIIARPTENVRIFDCRFDRGHGISIGSEMSGGVRGVLVEDCVAGPLLHGLQIKATPERGGFVEDITVRDCDLQQITVFTKLPYNNDGQGAPTPPTFRRFRFENIDLTRADPKKPAIIVNGFEAGGHETRDITFKNIRLPAAATIQLDRVADVTFTGITTPDALPPNYNTTRSTNIHRP